MRRLLAAPCVVLLCLAVATLASAQDNGPRKWLMQWNSSAEPQGGPPSMDEPLKTDRPDFTSASSTVGRGVVQIESGYTYAIDVAGVAGSRVHSYPEMLVRVGVLADWLEFRIAYDQLNTTNWVGPFASTMVGPADLYLGTSFQLTPQQGALPEMVLMVQTSVPTSPFDDGNSSVLPGVDWIYAWEITDWLSLAGSLQANRSFDPITTNNYVWLAWSWSAEWEILPDKLGAFTEFYGISPSSADTVLPQYYFDTGLTWLWTNNLQFDVRYGAGLNEYAADYYAGAGVSLRF